MAKRKGKKPASGEADGVTRFLEKASEMENEWEDVKGKKGNPSGFGPNHDVVAGEYDARIVGVRLDKVSEAKGGYPYVSTDYCIDGGECNGEKVSSFNPLRKNESDDWNRLRYRLQACGVETQRFSLSEMPGIAAGLLKAGKNGKLHRIKVTWQKARNDQEEDRQYVDVLEKGLSKNTPAKPTKKRRARSRT